MNYNKLTKKELAFMLERIEKRFTGLLEDAEKSAEDSKSKCKSDYILVFISSAIERTLNELEPIKKPIA